MSIIKAHISAMSAYKPPLDGRNPDTNLLLDFNERTLPVSEKVQQALIDYIRSGRLQVYPAYGDIVERIAEYAKVKASQLMITNGSDQGIELVFRSVCESGDEVVIPGPSFAMYTQCAKIENCTIISPQYTQESGFPLEEVVAAINPRVKLVVISNPNNPCGTQLAREGVESVLRAASSNGNSAAVLVDECYFEYTQESVCDLLDQYTNLIVTRTFSKTWGIPSLRFGYLMSCEQNISALLNVRGPYDINQLAVVAVRAALENFCDVSSYIEEVMGESKPALEAFLTEAQIPYWQSAANYIWAFPQQPEALELALRGEGVLVRPKADSDGRLGLRITLGTLEQTQRSIGVIRAFIEGNSLS